MQFDANLYSVADGDWIETTPEVLALIFPQGMGGKFYAHYKNKIICETGKKESALEQMDSYGERSLQDPVWSDSAKPRIIVKRNPTPVQS